MLLQMEQNEKGVGLIFYIKNTAPKAYFHAFDAALIFLSFDRSYLGKTAVSVLAGYFFHCTDFKIIFLSFF